MPDSSAPHQQVVEKVAEAIWVATVPGAAEKGIAFSEMAESTHKVFRVMAEAAIEALGLTEQWGAFYNDGTLADDIADDREHAEEQAAERCRSCDSCRGAAPKHVESRLVSPWRVGGDA